MCRTIHLLHQHFHIHKDKLVERSTVKLVPKPVALLQKSVPFAMLALTALQDATGNVQESNSLGTVHMPVERQLVDRHWQVALALQSSIVSIDCSNSA
jgi:uncharacterized protein (DUF2141 family)